MFSVIIPVYNQFETLRTCLDSWFALAKSRFDLILIDNGSAQPLADQAFAKAWQDRYLIKIIRLEKNVGVFPTFQIGMEATTSMFVFYSHSDVMMIEFGWDERLSSILQTLLWSALKPGVCGMFGAKGIGTPDIYKAPYDFRQLMRWDCVTVPSMMHGGSREINGVYERVAVLDGFSLIIAREMFRDVMHGEFDHKKYPPHHMYDQDICVASHYGGFNNFVLDVDCKHLGGVTSTREKWAEGFNTTDLDIHRKAHIIFYDKWRGKLPLAVK